MNASWAYHSWRYELYDLMKKNVVMFNLKTHTTLCALKAYQM